MQIKVHHCAIDGIAGIELMNALHDVAPEGRGLIVDPWRSGPDLDALALMALATANAIRAPQRAFEFMSRSATAVLPWAGGRSIVANWATRSRPPPTRLNQRVTINLVGDGLLIALAETK